MLLYCYILRLQKMNPFNKKLGHWSVNLKLSDSIFTNSKFNFLLLSFLLCVLSDVDHRMVASQPLGVGDVAKLAVNVVQDSFLPLSLRRVIGIGDGVQWVEKLWQVFVVEEYFGCPRSLWIRTGRWRGRGLSSKTLNLTDERSLAIETGFLDLSLTRCGHVGTFRHGLKRR